jgi:Uma2 family endonuclease
MSSVLLQPMTLEQFLAWEEHQTLCYEFDGWQPVAMTGGTDAHEAIGGTLRALLQGQLRGKPCRVRGPTLKIEVMGRVRYPDAFVYCTQVPPGETVIREPVVVFEVLSPGTSRTDRTRNCASTRQPPRSNATSSWSRTVSRSQSFRAITPPGMPERLPPARPWRCPKSTLPCHLATSTPT